MNLIIQLQRVSDTENPNIVEYMVTSDGNPTDVSIVQKKNRKLQTPGVTQDREWVDITDKKKMTNYQMVHFRTSYWKPVDVPKMKAFVGVILNMGLVKNNRIESYWNVTSYSQDTPMFRKVFTVRTFKLLLRFFHASDSDLEPRCV